ncbi:nuclear transport factor 2 family protein [uncultured Winogradskyella sp.]|uniref:nuclear transport factor 2 family protein n=1 Tax=uncultured Winogradskyella sp. TaxID=395353 RepID=UPI0035153197
MKSLIQLAILFAICFSSAQTNTEVVLFDLEIRPRLALSNFKNISTNEGYDNQPSFLSETRILFASTRNGQTDIAQYFADYDSKTWVNSSSGSEYSPQKRPAKNEVSAVRLDSDGKQALYAYNLDNGEASLLIDDLVVAYYVWVNETTIASAVIEDEQLNLYVSNLQTGTHTKYAENVGRSIHLIPDSEIVSFISKTNEKQWEIKSLNPKTGATRLLANTIIGVEDMCWLNQNTILAGKDAILYKLTLKSDYNWRKVADLSQYDVSNISRLAVNITTTKLAMAVELKPGDKTGIGTTDPSVAESIVQKQLDAYNKRDIDAFMATYSDNIKLYTYPNTLRTGDRRQMKASYEYLFANTPDLKAEIKNRIVLGNTVIDEEHVIMNGQKFKAVAIYEVENGLITKVTFIQ